MSTPITDQQYQLERMPGKGGWTYARITDVTVPKGEPFGMVRVKGSIDNYELESCSIMPMGNGGLFLPVKAAIRKAIKKEEGDCVHIILFKDDEPYIIPVALQLRLEEENVHRAFLKHKPGNKGCVPAGYLMLNALKQLMSVLLKQYFALSEMKKLYERKVLLKMQDCNVFVLYKHSL